MYSHAVQETPCYSRMAAAALLAVSAGACVGVALSPAVSSLYAPAAVQPAVASRVSAVNVPRTQMQAVPVAYGAEQLVQADVAVESVAPTSTVFAGVCGGLFAAAAAVAAIVYKGSADSSEQIAMLAAAGKKKAAPKASKRVASGERLLWYPTAEAPEWLDGSLPGDRGFDPLGLAKPTEFVQFDLDALDQNQDKNPAGKVVGRVSGNPDQLTGEAFAPYSEVFGLTRFRECELIHGRWAMLAALGCIVGEAVTGVAWQDAGLVEAGGYTYWNNPLPFTGGQVVWFEVLTMGFVEVFRNTELNTERRLYPGGAFDPLGLAAANDEGTFRLKEAELKHGRLAMIAFLGFAIASARTGLGVTSAFAEFATSFN